MNDELIQYIDNIIENQKFLIKDNNKRNKCLKHLFKLKKYISKNKMNKIQKEGDNQ